MGRAAPLMRVFGEDGEEESRDEIITEPSSIFNRLVIGEIFNQPLFMCSSFVIFALIELDNVSSGWVCGLHLSNVPTSKTFNQRKVLKTVVKVYSEVRRQKMALFRTLNETVGGWGSKVPNF